MSQRAVFLGLSLIIALITGLGLGVLGPLPALADVADQKVGAERCGECHTKEFKAWDQSTHSQLLTDSDDDEVLEQSEAIPEKLGIDDIEEAEECSSCHFTYYYDADGDEQLTSVDCESCHGHAKEWVGIHSDLGEKDGQAIEKPEDEDPAHAKQRWAMAVDKGMLRPSNIYAVASNCLQCHRGPSERVVNEGGHTPGSEFELVSWLGGEVRHNFHRTGQGANGELTPERKRQLFVVGQALDIESSLRGLASAVEDGTYATAMKARIERAAGQLEGAAGKVSVAELGEILAIVKAASLKPNNSGPLEQAASKVGAATQKLAASQDGSGLAMLDGLIPGKAIGTSYGD